jgi:hypothetical protein
MNRIFLLFLTCVSVLSLPRTHLAELTWQDDGLVTISPKSGQPVRASTLADLNSDGVSERITVTEGRAVIDSDSRIQWETPAEWEVRQAEITDLDGNQTPEITLLLWRDFAPWPIDAVIPHGGRIADFQDTNHRSCHIILIGWKRGAYRELWAGSALAEPVLEFFPADWNGDGHQELLSVETSFDLPRTGQAFSVWEWNGFGFSLLDRIRIDTGRSEQLISADRKPMLLFDRTGWFYLTKEVSS